MKQNCSEFESVNCRVPVQTRKLDKIGEPDFENAPTERTYGVRDDVLSISDLCRSGMRKMH